MSDEERYQIIGKVVADHEDAKKLLAALQAKAAAMGEFLHDAASVLQGNATWEWNPTQVQIKLTHAGKRTSYGHGAWPTLADAKQLTEEMDATKARIEALQGRRKELGV